MIYYRGGSWIYFTVSPDEEGSIGIHQIAVFNNDHTRGTIYNPDSEFFRKGNLSSLTLFTTDQILIARVLADRDACYFHAAGMIIDGQGVLFVGLSEAGKSTTVTMRRDEGEILCDDRTFLRHCPEGFRIHGTWSHGDVSDVTNSSAPLRAIFFLEQAKDNEILPIEDRKEIIQP